MAPPKVPSTANSSPRPSDHAAIAAKAYQLYVERGGEPGHELDDWLEAERQLARTAAPLPDRGTPARPRRTPASQVRLAR